MTDHPRNRSVSLAFAQGCRGQIADPAPLLPGTVFMYGCLRGLLPTLKQAVAERRRWYYADNGYFRRAAKNPESGHFRVTRDALQHDGSGQASSARWERLGLEIAPWRKSGTHILVCPPDATFGELWDMDVEAWQDDVLCRLRAATDRPIRVRHREDLQRLDPFATALDDCWALVTHQSNAAVEALLAGIPVFCTGDCAATRMGLPDLSRIEAPILPDDREQWAWNLASAQWTLAEMRRGQCWREVKCID